MNLEAAETLDEAEIQSPRKNALSVWPFPVNFNSNPIFFLRPPKLRFPFLTSFPCIPKNWVRVTVSQKIGLGLSPTNINSLNEKNTIWDGILKMT